MLKITFLVSGNGGTLAFLNEALIATKINAKIIQVIADRNCGAIEYAVKNNIESIIIDKNNLFTDLINTLSKVNPDIIITNIHKILSAQVLDNFKGKFINLHYSLLPAFAGLIGMNTVAAARKQNCKFIGATVHKVNEIVDAGDIIAQAILPIDWHKTKNIEDSVFKAACIILYNHIFSVVNKTASFFVSEQKLNQNTTYFSPPISPKKVFCEDEFWKRVAHSLK